MLVAHDLAEVGTPGLHEVLDTAPSSTTLDSGGDYDVFEYTAPMRRLHGTSWRAFSDEVGAAEPGEEDTASPIGQSLQHDVAALCRPDA